MIAHRLPIIQSADQILVVHNGQIVEYGKHQELLEVILPQIVEDAAQTLMLFVSSVESVTDDKCGSC